MSEPITVHQPGHGLKPSDPIHQVGKLWKKSHKGEPVTGVVLSSDGDFFDFELSESARDAGEATRIPEEGETASAVAAESLSDDDIARLVLVTCAAIHPKKPDEKTMEAIIDFAQTVRKQNKMLNAVLKGQMRIGFKDGKPVFVALSDAQRKVLQAQMGR